MASFQKRGKTWQFIVSRYVNGKYKPIRQGGFRTKREAEVVATEIENKLNKRKVLHLTPVLFPEYFKEWLDIYKIDISDNTRARYMNTYNTLKNYFSNTHIQDIDKREYQLFINTYGEKRHRTTVKKLNSHVKSCLLDAIDEGVLLHDFTRNVKLSGELTTQSNEKSLNLEEVKKITKYLKMKIYQMLDERELMENEIDLRYQAILLSLYTGMRFGEIVGLTKDSFNFDNNTIEINKTWGYTSKMHKGFGETKNRENRKIKTSKSIMDIFKRTFKWITPNDHELVFYKANTKYTVISNSGTNHLLKEITKKIDIEDINFHGLRHTHASILLYHKVSIQYVSERLGHKNITTTYKFYSHVIKELRKEDEAKAIKIFA